MVDHQYSGLWTNNSEGHLDPVDWGEVKGRIVTAAINVRGQAVTGDIHGDLLCSMLPVNYVMLEGRRKWPLWGPARVQAWDYIGGQRVYLADFEMELGSNGRLTLRSVQASPIFPDKVELVKIKEEAISVSDAVQPLCHNRDTRPSRPAASAPSQLETRKSR